MFRAATPGQGGKGSSVHIDTNRSTHEQVYTEQCEKIVIKYTTLIMVCQDVQRGMGNGQWAQIS